MNKEEYAIYLQSIEWSDIRNKIYERAQGWCERCKNDMASNVHHLTYKNVGHEELEDLQAVCAPCHKFLHKLSAYDPAIGKFLGKKGIEEQAIEEAKIKKYGIVHNGEFYYGEMALYHYRRMS